MTAKQLMEELISLAVEPVHQTVDTCKAGDPNREVKKVATCFIATPQVIRDAHAWGADLLITHEPTFYSHRDNLPLEGDAVTEAKRALLKQTGLVVWRYHDHIHACQPDGIIAGELDRLELPVTQQGWICRLQTPMTARELALHIKRKLRLAQVRVAGPLDTPLSTFAPLVGACGEEMQQRMFTQPEVDALLVGETSEWRIGEYARDAAQLGLVKCLLVLGHAGSERDGMEALAGQIAAAHPELGVKYLDCGEVYTVLDGRRA